LKVKKSDTGNIRIEASGFVTISATGKVESNSATAPVITSHGHLPEGFGIDLTNGFEWLEQGPYESTNGQVAGMDPQGNPVSAAIQSVFVEPGNEDVVYVATVNGLPAKPMSGTDPSSAVRIVLTALKT